MVDGSYGTKVQADAPCIVAIRELNDMVMAVEDKLGPVLIESANTVDKSPIVAQSTSPLLAGLNNLKSRIEALDRRINL